MNAKEPPDRDPDTRHAPLVALRDDRPRPGHEEQQRLRLRINELGVALRQKQEEFLDMLDRLQRREEQTVRRSEERFRLLVESVQDYAILMLGPDGVVASWNEGAQRISGFDESEAVGQHVQLLHAPHAVDLGLEEARETGRFAKEDWLVRRDGTPFWASILFTALRDEQGRILGFAAIIRDLTERRRAEEALRRSAADLERSNQELEQFAFVASHDLQEPLRKIQAFGERLDSRYTSVLPDEGRDYIARMRNGAQRMQVLIDDILTFSRIASRTEPFTMVNLTEVAEDAVTDLEHALEQTGGRVDVGALPTLQADRGQMRRLFQNLIGNALKFRRPDTAPVITLSAQGVPPVLGRETVYQVLVQDNGIGFDNKYRERIFGIFERLHGRTHYPGTGMGLAICRKIIERHGGTIVATSIVDRGATFIIELPYRQAAGGT